MDTLFPLFIGITGKIYDDIEDQKLTINPLITESLKSINLLFYTLTSKSDFMFSLSTFIMAALGAGIDNLFWKSFILIAIILSIISFTTFTTTNWKFFLVMISIVLILTHIEEQVFPEEYSIKKLISRILGIIIFASIYFIPSSYYIQKIFGNEYYIETGNINYFNKLILVVLGGLITSVISQIYFLFKSSQV